LQNNNNNTIEIDRECFGDWGPHFAPNTQIEGSYNVFGRHNCKTNHTGIQI